MRNKNKIPFNSFFLIVAIISSLLMTACGGGGGGGGGGNSSVPSLSRVSVTIPSNLFTEPVLEVRATTGLEKLIIKVVAYSNGKEKTDVKITDREATSNGTEFVATVDGLLNVYDYKFKAFNNETEVLSNLVPASEIVNDVVIKLDIDTSFKTIAYDSWLRKNPANASMNNFKENSKIAGLTKDSDYNKLSLSIGNNNYSVDQYKSNLLKVAKGESATIPTGSTAKINVDKIATSDKEAAEGKSKMYTITYNLNDGVISKTNPTKYGVASNSITLNNPTKNGYKFEGWTGSNGNTPQTNVVIQKGSKGDKTFSANWSIVSYKIDYNLDGGIVLSDNPLSYDITSETITLINPIKNGFEFLGWTGSNGELPQISVNISKGSTGNKSFVANWKQGSRYASQISDIASQISSGNIAAKSAEQQIVVNTRGTADYLKIIAKILDKSDSYSTRISSIASSISSGNISAKSAPQQSVVNTRGTAEYLEVIAKILDTSDSYSARISSIRSSISSGNISAKSAPQQTVVNTRGSAEYLEVIAKILDTSDKYSARISSIRSSISSGNISAKSAPQQSVVNTRGSANYLNVIATIYDN